MSKPGHNSKVQAGPVNADRLKSFIERIEKLEEERKAIGGDIKDVYSEAKGVGYDVGTMRKIVALRAKNSADVAEQEALLDVYKHALGMLTAGTVTTVRVPQEPSEEELEERAGRIAAEVDRCMDLVSEGQPLPSIADIRELIGCSTGKASKLRGMVTNRISRLQAKVREMKSAAEEEAEWLAFRREEDAPRDAHASQANDPAPQGSSLPAAPEASVVASLAGPPVPQGGEGTGTHSDEAPITPSVGAVASESERVAPPFLGDDPGPTLDFLRGPSPANRRVA